MRLPDTLVVPVTREHLQRATPGSQCNCAAALAIESELDRLGILLRPVEVDWQDRVWIGGVPFTGDEELGKLIESFDWLWTGRGEWFGPVAPCTFELTRVVDDDPEPAQYRGNL